MKLFLFNQNLQTSLTWFELVNSPVFKQSRENLKY